MGNVLVKKPVIVIAGPTAVGKTKLSLQVAEKLEGEIVSADSMQIYRYMNIGTAKPEPAEMRRIKHYMIDIVDPWQEFSVAIYQRMAKECIEEIQSRGKIPLVVGGTGLYINSLVYDLDFANTMSDKKYRAHLIKLVGEKGKPYLYNMLKKIDPETAERLHKNDVKRVIRALEVYHCSGKPMSKTRNSLKKASPYDLIIFGLRRERKELYKRVERRVDGMIEAGLIDEVKGLVDMGCNRRMVSMQGLGYKEIISFLEGECTLPEAVDILKRNTKRFAKRQFTWFGRDDRIIWRDIDKIGNKGSMLNTIVECIRLRLGI